MKVTFLFLFNYIQKPVDLGLNTCDDILIMDYIYNIKIDKIKIVIT